MNTLYKKETDELVEKCLAPFSNLSKQIMEAVNELDSVILNMPYSDNGRFLGENGKNIIHNTIYNMEEKYEIELNKLYKQFNVKNGEWYKLPKKEREECRTLYHSKPILKMMNDFISYSAHSSVVHNDPKSNPFIMVIAGYQRLYGDSIPFWIEKIKKGVA